MKQQLMSAALIIASLVTTPVYAACNGNIALTKPDSVFADHVNGTVTDEETGLMWMKCSLGLSGNNCATGSAATFTWAGALAEVQTANAGPGTHGYTDWRLPSIAELGSLVEAACANPAINTDIFPATVAGSYWTSSPYIISNDSAWRVSFSEGAESVDAKNSLYPVRLVRKGS